MTVVLPIPASIASITQDDTLIRAFNDPLFQRLLFRSEARPEVWPSNLGDQQVFTRTGLMTPNTTPLTPGTDPTPKSYQIEQWRAIASQYADSIDTNMPTNNVTLASALLRNIHTLGLNAGDVLNRLPRNRLYQAYTGGRTQTTAVSAIATTTVSVASINGFTERVDALGRLSPVGPANSIPVAFSGTAVANTVVGVTPANPLFPLGPGTLTLGAGLSAGVALREGVVSDFAAQVIRVGGGATVDAVTAATDILDLQSVINAVAILRENKVPPCSDGQYHVHISPTSVANIYRDESWQRLQTSLPDGLAYRDLVIGRLVGAYWYQNTEVPNQTNVGPLVDTSGGAASARAGTEVPADVINQTGVPIERTIVIGGGAMYEKYLDESKYITEAGVTGKIGQFSVTNGGVQVMTERIRFVMRAPLDRLQQNVSSSWSWSGDFPIPSDATTGSGSAFKRAIVIESS